MNSQPGQFTKGFIDDLAFLARYQADGHLNAAAKQLVDAILAFKNDTLAEYTKEIEQLLVCNGSDKVILQRLIHGRYTHVINTAQSYLTQLRRLTIHDVARNDIEALLGKLIEEYNIYWQKAQPPKKMLIKDPIYLYQERKALEQGAEWPRYQAALEGIKRHYSNAGYTPRRCFISYAWPIQSSSQVAAPSQLLADESWIQPFLKCLRKDLIRAGIQAILDIEDNAYGSNIYQFMDQASSSDFVLVIGTESLLKKHQTGLSAVCNELILIERKRREDRALGLAPRVFPILLTGVPESSFPPYFERYSTVRDWQKCDYISNVKGLVQAFYNAGTDNTDYKRLWQEFDPQQDTPSTSQINALNQQGMFAVVRQDDGKSEHIKKYVHHNHSLVASMTFFNYKHINQLAIPTKANGLLDCDSAQLQQAHLSKADFSKISFQHANFERANIEDALFCEADLSYADLSWCEGLDSEELAKASFDNIRLAPADKVNRRLCNAAVRIKRLTHENQQLHEETTRCKLM